MHAVAQSLQSHFSLFQRDLASNPCMEMIWNQTSSRSARTNCFNLKRSWLILLKYFSDCSWLKRLIIVTEQYSTVSWVECSFGRKSSAIIARENLFSPIAKTSLQPNQPKRKRWFGWAVLLSIHSVCLKLRGNNSIILILTSVIR